MAARAYVKFQLAPFAMTAINKWDALGGADADVLSLTTGAGLIAAVAAQSVKGDRTRDRDLCADDLRACVSAGVITDAGVAAADTIAGLRTHIQTSNANVATNHSAQHLNS